MGRMHLGNLEKPLCPTKAITSFMYYVTGRTRDISHVKSLRQFCSATTMLTRRVLRRLPVPSRPGNRLMPGTLLRPTLSSRRELATAPSTNDAFANGTNAYYADEMYRLWKHDPKSVHPSWDVYFSGLDKGLTSSQAFQPPPTVHLPHPADGAPALHVGKGAELDDHLKVNIIFFSLFVAATESGK